MEDGANEKADDDKEQHVGDALAAEDLAEQVCREDEQTNDGNGQPDLTRRAAVAHLLYHFVQGTLVDDAVKGPRECVAMP